MKNKILSLIIGLILTTNFCMAEELCQNAVKKKTAVTCGISVKAPLKLNMGCAKIDSNTTKVEKDKAFEQAINTDVSVVRLDVFRIIQIRIF